MKLSTRARYALRMMLVIARYTGTNGSTISLSEVAQKTRISRRYLEQLAISLRNAALIHGRTGKGGGYQLARAAEEIPISQVIEAAIGRINIVDCVLEPETCDMVESCGCRAVYCEINNHILQTLNDLTLGKLVNGSSKKKVSAVPENRKN